MICRCGHADDFHAGGTNGHCMADLPSGAECKCLQWDEMVVNYRQSAVGTWCVCGHIEHSHKNGPCDEVRGKELCPCMQFYPRVGVFRHGETRKYDMTDQSKPDWTLLQWSALAQILAVREWGLKKHKEDRWASEASGTHIKALFRHLLARAQGEMNDPESGFPHLAHAGCRLLMAMWQDINGVQP